MKKTLLSLGLAALTFGVFAQADCSDATTGFTDNYTTTDAAPSGLFYWGNLEDPATGQKPSFSYDRKDGMLEVTVSHANIGETEDKNIWAPMGLDINFATLEDVEAGTPTIYLDVDANPTGSVSVMNADADVAIEPYFTILSQDAAGNKLSANASLVGTTVSLYGGIIAAEGSAEITFDLENAVKRSWQANEEACDALGGEFINSNDCIESRGLIKTGVYGVEWSINAAASAESSWQNEPLTDHLVKIDFLKFGACTPTGLESNAVASGFEVFPNPAQNVINFNYTVNGAVEVELSNALGSAVSTTEGTSMNVAELPAGVYFATLKVNGVSTAVQRVQVQ